MPPDVSNPYRPSPGSLPLYLAGREGEVAAIQTALSTTIEHGPASPIVIIGLRGMGKTVLLRTAAKLAENSDALVLYGEAGDDFALEEAFRRSLQRAQRDLRNIPARLAAALKTIIETMPIPVLDLPSGVGEVSLTRQRRQTTVTLTETLEQLNEAASNAGRCVVICLDEVQDARPEHLRPIITYVHETAGTQHPILLLGAGLPNTPDHLKSIKTYTERWRYFDLGLFSRRETTDALSRPAAQRGVTIDAAALSLLVDESGGYPFFTQEYGSAIWAAREKDTISLQAVKSTIPGVRRSLEASLYERRFRGLTPRELRYALALADLGAGSHTVADVAASLNAKSTAEISSIRNRLIEKDIIMAPAHSLVAFRIPLTERYLAENRTQLEKRIAIDTKSRGQSP